MKHDTFFSGNDKVCVHLAPALAEIKRQGGQVASVGTPWSQNCRTWVYFENVVLDVEALRMRLNLPPCVTLAKNDDPRSGTESGLFCEEHHDALMGLHPAFALKGTRVIE